jgi:predicted dehydrogenase
VPPLRVAVIGTGAFGRNHLRVYRELEAAQPQLVQLAAIVEPAADRRSSFASIYNIPAFATITELLAANLSLDAASVCVPTLHHASVAEQLLLAGLDLLIEKPFAATLAQADHILALSQAHGRIVAIGHLERFNPAVTATLAVLNQPMFFESHRLSIFTPRSLDVDVVLDLMIHDLDIVLSLTNSPVREVRAVGLPILSPKTDIANVRVEFDSGCVANFTASRVSTEQVRKLRLFQPHQYLSLDFARQELLTISVDPAIVAAAIAAGSSPLPAPTATAAAHPHPTPEPSLPAHSEHPTAGLSLTKADIPKGEPLRLELEDFLHAVRARTQPRVPAEAGREALALALAINDQIAAHAHRAGLL